MGLQVDLESRPPIIAASALLMAFYAGAVGYLAYRAQTGLRDARKQLKDLASKLAKYLSPQLYNSLFTGEKEASINSSRRLLTVFFSDLRLRFFSLNSGRPEQ